MSGRNAIMAGQFIKKQLMNVAEGEVGVSPDDPSIAELFICAGGGLTAQWVERLASGLVGRITIKHLVGLRRLTGDPIDTILGLEYTNPANRGRMAGLNRIRHELGGDKPLTKKLLCQLVGCSYPIISRIEQFSTWAILNNAAYVSVSTAFDVERALSDTFSVDVLVRLKYATQCNIDDIVGLGDYSKEVLSLVCDANGYVARPWGK